MPTPAILSRAPLTRRRFLYSSALAAGATVLGGCSVGRASGQPANNRLNIGVVGVGGKGASDATLCSSENIVAICDVDEVISAPVRRRFPGAKFYRDYRKMLEQEKTLDAVVIATTDHTHAMIATMAMRMG